MQILAAILVAALLFAVPSIIAQWRRVRAFRSISALNALLVFTFVCGLFSLTTAASIRVNAREHAGRRNR